MKKTILAAMPLDPKQRHKLLLADRTGDAAWITAAIEQLLATDPDVDLLETVFREAAAKSYLVATDTGFCIVIGVQAWIAELDAAGLTPEQNRQALAGEPT